MRRSSQCGEVTRVQPRTRHEHSTPTRPNGWLNGTTPSTTSTPFCQINSGRSLKQTSDFNNTVDDSEISKGWEGDNYMNFSDLL